MLGTLHIGDFVTCGSLGGLNGWALYYRTQQEEGDLISQNYKISILQ